MSGSKVLLADGLRSVSFHPIHYSPQSNDHIHPAQCRFCADISLLGFYEGTQRYNRNLHLWSMEIRLTMPLESNVS